jgi:hypothetical protein
MKWVTRSRPRVIRTATAWLIRRFLDPGAEILFVDPQQVAGIQQREAATGFDAPGATHPPAHPLPGVPARRGGGPLSVAALAAG